jgi:superfamily II DNA/RNA helicase
MTDLIAADTLDLAADVSLPADETVADEPGFETLNLAPALLKALADARYDAPTEVQRLAIPPALDGRDLMVASSTGSGKTASFLLPALQRILDARREMDKKPELRRDRRKVYGPRVLVLAPTRELAQQVGKAATVYGRHVPGLRVATVVGGVPYPGQIRSLQGPLDILIATPGRLLDHLSTGKAVLDHVEMFVLDEADRMLDMGFIDDIHVVADAVPAERQTVMYSATFVGHVGRLAERLMKEPQRVEVASHTDGHADIEQRLHWADDGRHKDALLDHILTERDVEQAVVFTSTQRDADWLADRLAGMGHAVASLHGGMPQGRRNRVLNGLRYKELRVLVATDVAARGIDVPTISHVINYGLPMKPEDYVHRIGRTGRAGRQGVAVTLAERSDIGMIKRILRFTTQPIPVSQITGLEPRMREPDLTPQRPAPGSRFGNGGPSYGPRGGGFNNRGGFGGPGRFDSRRPSGPRGFDDRGGWAQRPDARGDQRRDDSPFSGPRGFDGPRDRPPAHGPRSGQRFDPAFKKPGFKPDFARRDDRQPQASQPAHAAPRHEGSPLDRVAAAAFTPPARDPFQAKAPRRGPPVKRPR